MLLRRTALLLPLLLTLHCVAAAGAPWSPDRFPNPKTDFQACGRAVAGNVCDPDQLLSAKSKDYVAGVLRVGRNLLIKLQAARGCVRASAAA